MAKAQRALLDVQARASRGAACCAPTKTFGAFVSMLAQL